jgi:DNA-directed RNA polymerase sigma subunit (sigma70/sigma32)
MTYWEQECGERSLQERLSEIINNKDVSILDNDNELFRVLKRHLTRKELHAFCMREGGKTDEEVAQRVSVKSEDVELLLKKALRKIKQSKVTSEVFVKNEV